MQLSDAVYVLLYRLYLRVFQGDRERGDVPGWVLITVMTAGLVMALWVVAGPKLAQMLDDALSSVNAP